MSDGTALHNEASVHGLMVLPSTILSVHADGTFDIMGS